MEPYWLNFLSDPFSYGALFAVFMWTFMPSLGHLMIEAFPAFIIYLHAI